MSCRDRNEIRSDQDVKNLNETDIDGYQGNVESVR